MVVFLRSPWQSSRSKITSIVKFMNTFIQYLLPQHTVSRIMGALASCKISWFKKWGINKFIRDYQVDMSLAQEPNPLNYVDFHHFFTRALKPELRPITQEPNALASPADGVISQIGNVEANSILQAKGFTYDVTALLGGSRDHAALFNGGGFATVYLAPKDYHRVHMPFSGKLLEMIYVPGRLFSVNQTTAESVPNLFTRNERVVALFETAMGPMAVILVGAFFVGGIITVWHGAVTPPHGGDVRRWQYQTQDIQLQRGAEMGRFQMGSTVIVLVGSKQLEWLQTLQAGSSVQFGQLLGTILG